MNKRAAYFLLAPTMFLFLLVIVAPIVLVSRLSFFRTDYVTTAWVGWENYKHLLTDKSFFQSFSNAGFYILVITSTILLVSYLLASGIYEMGKRLQSALIFALYAPTLASGIISAMMWKWMFTRNGLINYLTGLIGIPEVPWFAIGFTARLVVCIVVIATNLGGYVLIFLANMLAVPKELFDQAAVDGASRRQAKLYIMFPQMSGTLILVSLLCLLSAAQLWETVMWLTNGGPGGQSATPVYDAYLMGFSYGMHGMAAAKSVIIMIAIAGISILKRRIEKTIAHE